jgi:hypothetical protein
LAGVGKLDLVNPYEFHSYEHGTNGPGNRS